MKKIVLALFCAFTFASCAKLQPMEATPSVDLNSLKCFVYYDGSNMAMYKELDLLSGMYDSGKGIGSFTFPDDASLYNSKTLSRCRVEASVAVTSRIVMTDEDGLSKDWGLDGWMDLYNNVLCFKILASDGQKKQYKISCKCKN